MKKLTILLLLTFLTLIVSQSPLVAQDKLGGNLSGNFFGDYYYKVGGNTVGGVKDFQAFQLRRLYLDYNYIFGDNFSGQIRFEVNNTSVSSEGKLAPFLKNAFIEWKNILPDVSFFAGIIPTPTWSESEKAWGYRCVEKTILDMRGFGSGSDMGFSLKGKVADIFNWWFMIANGAFQKSETNKYKRFYFEVNSNPIKDLTVELYADYEPVGPDYNKTLLKGLLGYKITSDIKIGAEVISQTTKYAPVGSYTSPDLTPFGFSVFGSGKINEQLTGFVRFDTYDPNSNFTDYGSSTYNENFITLGVDFTPIKQIHCIPNIWINTYSDKSSKAKATSGYKERDSDVMAKLTFFYEFK